jgi:hypothetical protein
MSCKVLHGVNLGLQAAAMLALHPRFGGDAAATILLN